MLKIIANEAECALFFCNHSTHTKVKAINMASKIGQIFHLVAYLLLPSRREKYPSNDKLLEAAEFSELLSKCSGVVVIIGLVIEVWLALRFPESELFLQKWGPVIADIFVAMGVVGEVLFSAIGSGFDKKLRENIRIESENEKRKSDQKIAEANERSAKAELELAKLKSPRVLTGEQITAISEALRPLAGQKYDLSLPRMMEPGGAINTQYIATLRMAGWRLQSIKSQPRRMINITETIFNTEPPVADGQFNVVIPPIEIGVSDGWIGLFVCFEQGDDIKPHTDFLKALWDNGVEAHLGCLSELKPGAPIPQKLVPSTVHLIIGSKN